MREKNKRNSSIELLRIIAMTMIIFGHSSTKGGIIENASGINNLLAHFMGLADLGSMIFLVISFNFIIDSKFDFNHFFSLWFKTFFYGSALTFAAIVAGCNVNLSLIQNILPISGRPYWFVTAYLITYFLHPFYDLVLSNVKKVLFRYILIFTIIFIVIPFLFNNSVLSGELLNLFYIYSITYYIKKNGIKQKWWNGYKALIIGVTGMLIAVSINFLIQHWDINHNINYALSDVIRFSGTNSIIMIIAAFSFFRFFQSKVFYSRIVNFIAKSSLSVYLIHCYPLIKNDIIWNSFGITSHYNSNFLYLFVTRMVLTIWGLAILIDVIERGIQNIIMRSKWYKEKSLLINAKLYER